MAWVMYTVSSIIIKTNMTSQLMTIQMQKVSTLVLPGIRDVADGV